MSHYGSFQYTIDTIAGSHELGVEYFADGDYVEVKEITLHQSLYFGKEDNRSRYMRDMEVSKLKQHRLDEIHGRAVQISGGF